MHASQHIWGSTADGRVACRSLRHRLTLRRKHAAALRTFDLLTRPTQGRSVRWLGLVLLLGNFGLLRGEIDFLLGAHNLLAIDLHDLELRHDWTGEADELHFLRR